MFIVPVARDSRQVARLLDDTLERFFAPTNEAVASTAAASAARRPPLDVVETEAAYTVKLEVPGVAKEDVKVAIDGRKVSVQASSAAQLEQKEGEQIVYRERTATRYARSFTLPLEVDQAEANAKLEHGVLTLSLPKRGVRAAAQLTVN